MYHVCLLAGVMFGAAIQHKIYEEYFYCILMLIFENTVHISSPNFSLICDLPCAEMREILYMSEETLETI